MTTYAKYQTITGLSSASYTVTFKWYRIDSWDSEWFRISVNGTQILTNNLVHLILLLDQIEVQMKYLVIQQH
jgi:hypothetical protein